MMKQTLGQMEALGVNIQAGSAGDLGASIARYGNILPGWRAKNSVVNPDLGHEYAFILVGWIRIRIGN